MGRVTIAQLQSDLKERNRQYEQVVKQLAERDRKITQLDGKNAALDGEVSYLASERDDLTVQRDLGSKQLAERDRKVAQFADALAKRNEDIERLSVQLRIATEGLREIAESSWPRLSRTLIAAAQDALVEIRARYRGSVQLKDPS